MADAAQKRSDTARSRRISLLSEKREQERLKREALIQIAGLTSRLEASDQDKVIQESSQYALEMAVWAFSNIYVSLSNAKYFWESMAANCDQLYNPRAVKLITSELKYTPEDKQERIDYYTREPFMQTAVFYLIRWKALETICDQYVAASVAARAKVVDNIKKQPTISEARAQLADLKAALKAKLDGEVAQSDARTAHLNAQQQLLQSVK